MNISQPGVHRRKAVVNRLWFKQHMDRHQMTQGDLSRAIARETGEPELDLASMSRRFRGFVRFRASEAQALHKIFGVPLDEVMQAIGGGTEIPITGSVDDLGNVTFTVQREEPRQMLTLDTTDGLGGALLTIEALPKHANPDRGLHVVQVDHKFVLRKLLGKVAGKWIISPLFGEAKVEQVENPKFLAKVTTIRLP